MSLTLTEKYTEANDPTFIQDVKMQAISSAISIFGSSTDPVVKSYCQLIINDSENTERASKIAHVTAAQLDIPDITQMNDSFIKTYLELNFTALAYAEFNKV